jgi:hypothetical protein
MPILKSASDERPISRRQRLQAWLDKRYPQISEAIENSGMEWAEQSQWGGARMIASPLRLVVQNRILVRPTTADELSWQGWGKRCDERQCRREAPERKPCAAIAAAELGSGVAEGGEKVVVGLAELAARPPRESMKHGRRRSLQLRQGEMVPGEMVPGESRGARGRPPPDWLLLLGYDIRAVQAPLGHKSVSNDDSDSPAGGKAAAGGRPPSCL